MTGSAEEFLTREKELLRANLRGARTAMSAEDREEQAIALGRVVVDHLTRPGASGVGADPSTAGPIDAAQPAAPGTVAAYLGVDPEPSTRRLLTELHRTGFDVVVPVCEADHALTWTAWWPGVPLARSVRAPVLEPTGPREPFGNMRDVRVVLVPALGVDTTGARIGQGGGYYDRFLAEYAAALRGGAPAMGVVYRSELLGAGSVPVGPFDAPLSGAFTADGPRIFERPSAV